MPPQLCLHSYLTAVMYTPVRELFSVKFVTGFLISMMVCEFGLSIWRFTFNFYPEAPLNIRTIDFILNMNAKAIIVFGTGSIIFYDRSKLFYLNQHVFWLLHICSMGLTIAWYFFSGHKPKSYFGITAFILSTISTSLTTAAATMIAIAGLKATIEKSRLDYEDAEADPNMALLMAHGPRSTLVEEPQERENQ